MTLKCEYVECDGTKCKEKPTITLYKDTNGLTTKTTHYYCEVHYMRMLVIYGGLE